MLITTYIKDPAIIPLVIHNMHRPIITQNSEHYYYYYYYYLF
jgi:hypothetical protein